MRVKDLTDLLLLAALWDAVILLGTALATGLIKRRGPNVLATEVKS